MSSQCGLCVKIAHTTDNLAEMPDLVWAFPSSFAWLGPWQFYRGYCILVARQHASELFQLADGDRRALLDEMTLLAQAIAEEFTPRKMNYELLGNQVPHLHWHLFPRYANDPLLLKPVWLSIDQAERQPESKATLMGDPTLVGETIQRLRQRLTRLMDGRS